MVSNIHEENNIIETEIDTEIERCFDQNTFLELHSKNIYVNEDEDIVIELQYDGWSCNNVVFIFDKNTRDMYRIYHRCISIPKPYRYYTNNEKVGPFLLCELCDNLID